MENLKFALEVMLVGFSLVLFTLFILYLIIIMLGKLFALKTPSFNNTKFIVEEEAEFDNLTPQKAAIISGAISAYLYEESTEYTIKRIEPLNSSLINRWAYQGRKELVSVNQEIDKLRRDQSGKKII